MWIFILRLLSHELILEKWRLIFFFFLKGLRPTIPKNTNPKLAELLKRCWQQDPSLRPDFSEILEILRTTTKEVYCPYYNLYWNLVLYFDLSLVYDDFNVGQVEDRPKEKSNRFLSVIKRNHWSKRIYSE